MKKLTYFNGIGFGLMLVCLILWGACKESELRQPLENDSVKPGVVTSIKVINEHGGARISYALPEGNDILYVTADYEIRPGVALQSVSSLYGNSLLIQGFADTATHQVTLRVADRSGNFSDPVYATIKPMIAPVQQVFDELSYQEDFGGITVNFENQSRADLSISVLRKDSIGDWVLYDKYYTSRSAGSYPVRGLPAELTTFGVFITDRWSNNSDTLVSVLTPLYEAMFPKNKFAVLTLAGDAVSAWSLAGMWDNINPHPGGFSNQNNPFPKWFSFDMGVKGKLSRFRLWGVHDGREFSGGNIKQFELWGTNNPSPDGSFDGWDLLGEYEVVKPSGPGALTTEDKAAAANGMDFSVPIAAPEVRYIRLKVISTFASPPNSTLGACWATEITMWGQEIQ